jgi:hypothetical protein
MWAISVCTTVGIRLPILKSSSIKPRAAAILSAGVVQFAANSVFEMAGHVMFPHACTEVD